MSETTVKREVQVRITTDPCPYCDGKGTWPHPKRESLTVTCGHCWGRRIHVERVFMPVSMMRELP